MRATATAHRDQLQATIQKLKAASTTKPDSQLVAQFADLVLVEDKRLYQLEEQQTMLLQAIVIILTKID